MNFDYLVVGAGFSGSVIAERISSLLGKRVLIVEQRNHIAGNAYDYFDENGVLVHKFGPHIFHTNSKKVWDYLSDFTEWIPYYHRVLGMIDGEMAPIPFNLNSLYKLFPSKNAEAIEVALLKQYKFGEKITIQQLQNNKSKQLQTFAAYIYEKVFHGYTVKQWGLRPEELDASVTGRVPIFISRDNRYFQDKYQAIPKHGYTEMFRRMLNSPNIKLLLNTDYKEIIADVHYNKLIFTGPIDMYFDYKFGRLPYRSLRFEFEFHNKEEYQEVGQINYPNEFEFTRITEFKKLTHQQNITGTTIAREYPEVYKKGFNEPYYPVPKKEYREQYMLYETEAQTIKDKVIFAGRLAEYKYYNMDQIVARALHLFEKEIKAEKDSV
ncbi:UDP-galactopyranose mutase [Fictibacillus sp. NRS-1165]|uniref:UDP-galactopyranose mutase n=1 Tax=Fictibacillus sp. NRS-1165 TaxID=3144463 RepID=UPI003D2169B5